MVSWLDKLVLSVAPERGLRRIRARTAAQAVMNYDGASLGRRTSGWKAPGTDADSAAYGSRARLRNLSRDMIRNRPYARRGQAVITGNVVGTGIMPAIVCENETRKKGLLDLVDGHLMSTAIDVHGDLNLPAMQRVVMNTVFSDGEVLARKRFRKAPFDRGLELPFQVEILEVDQLDGTVLSNGENEVVEGVEYDPIGRIAAYHILTEHPGNVSRFRTRKYESTRVPASEILHIRSLDRPQQSRGVPWLAPVMLTLGELADYQEAQILKQKVASLLAFFIESDDQAYTGKAIEDLAPGAVVGLAAGQHMTPTDPPTVDGYDLFMRQGLAAVAMGLGVTYESLAGDLSGVNFSSGRMGRIEMDRLVESWQQLIMIDQFCSGIGRWFREHERLVNPRGDKAWRLTWTAPKRALIDPNKEIPAIVQKIEAGLSSTQREQRQLGLDPEAIRKERMEDDDAGVLLPMKGVDTATPPQQSAQEG